ncbi:MAG TPA: hypothetical protein VHY22_10265 [Chthoniobacteraceae bacterium]|nr:hypothetical protein [Chthoniobacteraceae bacterium]
MSRRTAAICLAGMGVVMLAVYAACETNLAHVNSYGYALVVSREVEAPNWIYGAGWCFIATAAVMLWAAEVGISWASKVPWRAIGQWGIVMMTLISLGGLLGWLAWSNTREKTDFDPAKPFVLVAPSAPVSGT